MGYRYARTTVSKYVQYLVLYSLILLADRATCLVFFANTAL